MIIQHRSNINFNDYFYCDETSPSGLRWKIKREQTFPYYKVLCNVGDVAGKQDPNGYWVVRSRGLLKHGERMDFMAHRVVYEIYYEQRIDKSFDIDHIDRNPSNNNINNLRVVTRKLNCRNRSVIEGKLGSGVSLCTKKWPIPDEHKTTDYYLARVTTEDGKRLQKHFSIPKYGHDEAFRLACDWRNKMIAELNEQGAGYTENHGK